MMGTEIFKIDAYWAEKLTKTRVAFLMNPSVMSLNILDNMFTELEGSDRLRANIIQPISQSPIKSLNV